MNQRLCHNRFNLSLGTWINSFVPQSLQNLIIHLVTNNESLFFLMLVTKSLTLLMSTNFTVWSAGKKSPPKILQLKISDLNWELVKLEQLEKEKKKIQHEINSFTEFILGWFLWPFCFFEIFCNYIQNSVTLRMQKYPKEITAQPVPVVGLLQMKHLHEPIKKCLEYHEQQRISSHPAKPSFPSHCFSVQCFEDVNSMKFPSAEVSLFHFFAFNQQFNFSKK